MKLRYFYLILQFPLPISFQFLNLDHRRRCNDTLPPFPFFRWPQGISWPHHCPSLMLSFHLFFCHHGFLAPFTVHCRIVFTMLEDLEMWPYHFTMNRRSTCTPNCVLDPGANHLSCHTDFEGNVQKSYSIPSQEIGSFVHVLLWGSSCHMHKRRQLRWAFLSAEL